MTETEKISIDDLMDFSLSSTNCTPSSLPLPTTTYDAKQPPQQAAPLLLPTLTKNDIDLAHDRGYKKGKEDALVEIEHLNKEKEHAILERIHNALQISFKPVQIENNRNIDTHLDLCVEFLKTYTSRMNARLLPENIETLLAPLNDIGKTQANLFRWFNITVHPDDIEFCKSVFADKEKFQLDTPLKFLPDETLHPGDCIVEWQDGALHQRYANIASQLDQMIEKLHGGLEEEK